MTCSSVEFHDGSVEHNIDVVIFSTGFILHVPFLDADVLDLSKLTKTKPGLYRYTFPTHLPHSTLALIGFIRISGPTSSVFEMQVRWCLRIFKVSGGVEI